jgi:hypothetical protein
VDRARLSVQPSDTVQVGDTVRVLLTSSPPLDSTIVVYWGTSAPGEVAQGISGGGLQDTEWVFVALRSPGRASVGVDITGTSGRVCDLYETRTSFTIVSPSDQ